MPLLEDDTEVGGVPGEEHLQKQGQKRLVSLNLSTLFPFARIRKKRERGKEKKRIISYIHAAHGRHVVATMTGHVVHIVVHLGLLGVV